MMSCETSKEIYHVYIFIYIKCILHNSTTQHIFQKLQGIFFSLTFSYWFLIENKISSDTPCYGIHGVQTRNVSKYLMRKTKKQLHQRACFMTYKKNPVNLFHNFAAPVLCAMRLFHDELIEH